MNQLIRRRAFLSGSLAAGVAITTASKRDSSSSERKPKQEFYELRIYRSPTAAKQQVVLAFVEKALRPALNRQGIDRIGIFKPDGKADTAVYVVIPYPSLDLLALQNDKLEADDVYQAAAAAYFALPKAAAPYTRIESRLLRAFAGLPTLAAPSRKSGTRIVELRIYESRNEQLAKRKVEMFNQGEIDLMRSVGMAPVFFGETLIASDVPNLTYMLSADSPAAHKAHWAAFLKHAEWDRMKNLSRYKGTVSKIVSVTMMPTAGSQL